MIGQELRIEQYNHEATCDAIRHYAFEIGDDNPLWCDESYAAAGPFGTMVGPPTFFLSVFAPTLSPVCSAGRDSTSAATTGGTGWRAAASSL
jgi:acyl dehydratase